ncbi:MAG: hypothetical protein AB7E10_01790 [Burkholderiaceae bacterium]
MGVDSENAPRRGQFLPDSQPHSGAMGQEDGKKWAAAAHSQPTIPKSDRLLGPWAPQPSPRTFWATSARAFALVAALFLALLRRTLTENARAPQRCAGGLPER